MTKSFKKIAAVSVLTASCLTAGVASAEFTGNIGVTSNYLFRGETQSADTSAISGGLDYAHDSGLYIGTWTSSLDGGAGYEIDGYLGFAGEAGGLGYDVGYIRYEYPADGNEFDFQEVYFGVSYGMVTAKYSYSDDYLNLGEAGQYAEIGVDIPVKDDLTLALHYGYKHGDVYDEDNAAYPTVDGSYGDYSVSLVKGDFTFAVSDTDNENIPFPQSDNPRVAVSWSKSFDL